MSRKTSPHQSRTPRRPRLPELSDEAAYMIQFFLDDFCLWFGRAYATQIRRYHEPWYSGPSHSSGHVIDEPF